jgi:hypothetical protein
VDAALEAIACGAVVGTSNDMLPQEAVTEAASFLSGQLHALQEVGEGPER